MGATSVKYSIIPQAQRIPLNTATPSMFGRAVTKVWWTEDDLAYWEGCAVAELSGAKAVVNAIKKYGSIRIESD